LPRKKKYSLFFPYSPRKYQEETVEWIYKNITRVNLFLDAPTGFGKTPVILAGILPYIHHKDATLIWAVRTGNETDRPIEELKEIVRTNGVDLFGLSYRGKRDMCLLARDKGFMEYDTVSYLCEKSKKNCPYYQSFLRMRLPVPDEPLLYSEILNLAREMGVCPYYLQRELVKFADVVSLSYNYIVSPLGWSIFSLLPKNLFLVVDEAHNLQYAVSSVNSDRITSGTLKRAINELEKINTSRSLELVQSLVRMLKEIDALTSSLEKDEDTIFNPLQILYASNLSSGDVESFIRYGSQIRSKLLSEGKPPRSSLYHLGNFWKRCLQNLNTLGIAFIAQREKESAVLELWDMRAAEILKDKWPFYKSCVFCSGTLKPISGFAETIGVSNYKPKSVPSIYNLARITTLIVRGLSTRGEALSDEMRQKYLDALNVFVKETKSNIAIFSASYRIQNLFITDLKKMAYDSGKELFVEYEGMSGDEGRRILDSFKECAKGEKKGILMATMTGRFAEGADFPGEELEAIFLIGIPFDRVTSRTRLYIDYYESLYGEDRGYFLAYIAPALRRASQALGRVLRSASDNALFVCGDERYAQPKFKSLLPEYVQEPSEITEVSQLEESIMQHYNKIKTLDFLIKTLKEAITNQSEVMIEYLSQNTVSKRTIIPKKLEEPYLEAYCKKRRANRTFRIDKILSCQIPYR